MKSGYAQAGGGPSPVFTKPVTPIQSIERKDLSQLWQQYELESYRSQLHHQSEHNSSVLQNNQQSFAKLLNLK